MERRKLAVPLAEGPRRVEEGAGSLNPSTDGSAGWDRAADEKNCFAPAAEGPSGVEKRA